MIYPHYHRPVGEGAGIKKFIYRQKCWIVLLLGIIFYCLLSFGLLYYYPSYNLTDMNEEKWISNENGYHYHSVTTVISSSMHWSSRYEAFLYWQENKVQSTEDSSIYNKYRSCRLLRFSLDKSVDSDIIRLCHNLLKTQYEYEMPHKSYKTLYYNSLPRERFVCGNVIKPHHALVLNEPCYEPSRVFSSTPGRLVQGRILNSSLYSRNLMQPGIRPIYAGVDPIIVSYTDDVPFLAALNNNYDQCDVPCSTYGVLKCCTWNSYIQRIDSVDKKFEFLHSLEGSGYYPELEIDRFAWKRNKFLGTTSYQSEIPLSYYPALMDISFPNDNPYLEPKINQNFHDRKQNKLVKFEDAIKGAVFIATNCRSLNNREGIVRELIKNSDIFRIDSISKCLHNANAPKGFSTFKRTSDYWGAGKLEAMRHYLFSLVFENQCTADYITEKLWHAFIVGSIPIYYGAPNVREYVPSNSIILLNDYCSDALTANKRYISSNCNLTALSEYLSKVANNIELYDSYHEWRKSPFPENLQKKYNFTRTHATCRQCRWAFTRMYGIGWDHEQQAINETLKIGVTRNACVKELTGLIYSPFQEDWIILNNNSSSNSCSGSGSNFLQISSRVAEKETNCDLDSRSQTILIQHIDGNITKRRIMRTMLDQDGVIDIFIDWTQDIENQRAHATEVEGKHLVMKIKTLFSGPSTFSKIEFWRFRIQDDKSRLSILMWPYLNSENNNTIFSPENGVVYITIKDLPIKLRFISEDIDTLHDGAFMYDNFFGSLMAKDFFFPVEPFVLIDQKS